MVSDSDITLASKPDMEEKSAVLPGRLTDIASQKNKKNRVSLYVEEEFFGGFYLSVIKKAGLRKGNMITEEVCNKLHLEERRFKIREQIFRWLSIRNHCTGEILAKCRQKGYSIHEAEGVISDFVVEGLLDDADFARQFAEGKSKGKAWGPVKIRAALSKKGVKKQYIDHALESLITDNSDVEILVKAAKGIRNRLLREESGFKRKKKLTDFLIRRGFHSDMIYENVDDVLNKLEHEETKY